MPPISLEQCGIIILASGRSIRFGQEDKLLANFQGAPLAQRVARMVAALNVAHRIAILPPARPQLEALFRENEIDIKINPSPDAGIGFSIAVGIKAIMEKNCAATFILLADMPFIKETHLRRLLKALHPPKVAIASNGTFRTPPALFTQDLFPDLAALSGDRGAQSIIASLAHIAEVKFSPEDLADFDTPADFKN